MSIASAVCSSFKAEVLQALHNFTASSGNSFKFALLVYNANLNEFPDDAVKLWIALKTSVLKLLHTADAIDIIFFS